MNEEEYKRTELNEDRIKELAQKAALTIRAIDRENGEIPVKVDQLSPVIIDAIRTGVVKQQGDDFRYMKVLLKEAVLRSNERMAELAKAEEALQRLGPMPTLHEGNRASIQLKREDYEFIQAARR